jgi:hypothetical protein
MSLFVNATHVRNEDQHVYTSLTQYGRSAGGRQKKIENFQQWDELGETGVMTSEVLWLLRILGDSRARLPQYRMNVLRRVVPPDHPLLDSAPNREPLISCWEINKFENCWYKNDMILEVLKLFFQQFLNFPSSTWVMSGPILGGLSNNRWSGVYPGKRLHLTSLLANFYTQQVCNGCWSWLRI